MTRELMTSLHRAMAGDREGGDLASLHRLGAHLLRCYEASRDQAVFAWYSQVSGGHHNAASLRVKDMQVDLDLAMCCFFH